MRSSDSAIHWSPSAGAATSVVERAVVVVCLTGAAIAALVGLYALRFSPIVFIDESWNSNAGWNIVTEGTNFDSMFKGVLDQWERPWVRWPLLGNIPLAIAFKLGGLGIFQARLTSWLFGLVLLWLVYLLGRRLYGAATGALAVLLLSLNHVFWQASHYARVDIFLACFALGSLYLLVRGIETRRPREVLLAGLIGAVSVDIHMNGALFSMALVAVLVGLFGRGLWSGRERQWLLALAIGGAIGTAYWAFVHLVPDPSTYFEISRGWQGSMMRPPVASLSVMALVRSLAGEVGRYRFFEHNLDFALISAAVLVLLVRRGLGDRVLLIFTGTAFALFVLTVQTKNDVYAILFYPLLLLMVAEALGSIVRDSAGSWLPRVFAAMLALMMAFNSVVHVARPARQQRDYDYDRLTARMREHIPAGARVAGMPTWWLGFATGYDFRAIMGLTYYHVFNGYSVGRGLDVMQPQYVILDTALEGILVDDPDFSTQPGFGMYNLPRREFDEFIATRGRQIDEFTDPWHGRFRIFEIR